MGPRRTLFAVALIFIAGACVKQPPTGIGLQNVDAEVIFGVEKESPATLPVSEVPSELIPEVPFDPVRKIPKGPGFSTSPAAAPCPSAPPSAAAPKAAPFNSEELPQPGTYRWKRNGVQELTRVPGLKIPIGGFETRLIRNVVKENASDHRFEMVQPDLTSNDVVVTTFRVKTAAVNQRPPGLPNSRIGDADRGLSIVKVERRDPKTNQLKSVFTPQPSVLLLPLPVLQGETFQGFGADTSGQESLQVNGEVEGRKLVDACGGLIDGWVVTATRTTSRSGTQTTGKYSIIVATQLGSLPILEFFELQDANGKVSITISIGQNKPDS